MCIQLKQGTTKCNTEYEPIGEITNAKAPRRPRRFPQWNHRARAAFLWSNIVEASTWDMYAETARLFLARCGFPEASTQSKRAVIKAIKSNDHICG